MWKHHTKQTVRRGHLLRLEQKREGREPLTSLSAGDVHTGWSKLFTALRMSRSDVKARQVVIWGYKLVLGHRQIQDAQGVRTDCTSFHLRDDIAMWQCYSRAQDPAEAPCHPTMLVPWAAQSRQSSRWTLWKALWERSSSYTNFRGGTPTCPPKKRRGVERLSCLHISIKDDVNYLRRVCSLNFSPFLLQDI